MVGSTMRSSREKPRPSNLKEVGTQRPSTARNRSKKRAEGPSPPDFDRAQPRLPVSSGTREAPPPGSAPTDIVRERRLLRRSAGSREKIFPERYSLSESRKAKRASRAAESEIPSMGSLSISKPFSPLSLTRKTGANRGPSTSTLR